MIAGVAFLPSGGNLVSGMEKSADKQPAKAMKILGKVQGVASICLRNIPSVQKSRSSGTVHRGDNAGKEGDGMGNEPSCAAAARSDATSRSDPE